MTVRFDKYIKLSSERRNINKINPMLVENFVCLLPKRRYKQFCKIASVLKRFLKFLNSSCKIFVKTATMSLKLLRRLDLMRRLSSYTIDIDKKREEKERERRLLCSIRSKIIPMLPQHQNQPSVAGA